MINRQKGIIIGVGAALGLGCIGLSVLFFNALATSREAEQQRDSAYEQLKSLYQAKVFPKQENIKRVKDDQKELELWEANVSNFLAKSSVKADDLTPVRFKQSLQKTVRSLASRKSVTHRTLVAEDFKFGFDRYLGDSDSLPQTGDVPKLAQQLHLIQAVVHELYEANITKLTLVERETFEADAIDKQPGRPRPAGPSRPTPAVRPGQNPQKDVLTGKGDGMNPVLSPLLTRQNLKFGFQAKPSALMGVLNRLAAMDAFVVISSLEFKKSEDVVLVAVDKKKAAVKASEETKTTGAGAAAVPEAVSESLVTDPEREPPLDVQLSVDVYLPKGV